LHLPQCCIVGRLVVGVLHMRGRIVVEVVHRRQRNGTWSCVDSWYWLWLTPCPICTSQFRAVGFSIKSKYRLSEQVFSRQAGNDTHATVRCASALPDQSTGLSLCHCVLGTAHPSPRQARSSIDLVMLIAAPLRTVKTLEPTLLVSTTTACINLSPAADEHVRQPLFLQIDSLAIVHDG